MIDSPFGPLKLVASDQGLSAVLWAQNRFHFTEANELSQVDSPLLSEAEKQLREYFKGHRKSFSLPLDPQGTDFQKTVWKALRDIPYGKTWSYGELARSIERPRAVRAVGAANGKNPLAIIVPCHRVIGANGKLVGFSGGLPVKEKLLQIESKQKA